MNKNRLYIGLLVAVMLAVLVYASYGMVNAGKKESYYSVAVIVDDSSTYHRRWRKLSFQHDYWFPRRRRQSRRREMVI